MRINIYNTANNQNQGQNQIIISTDAENAFENFNITYDKNPEETRNRKNVHIYNKY
jgi:hypothetical protein